MDIVRDIRVVRFLPAYFSTISRLLGLLSEDEPSIHEITQAVSADQSLVARLLCVVNSPVHGSVRQIGTVDEAVVRVGLVGLRNITLAVAMADVTGGVKWKEWSHSLLVAHISDMISKKLRSGDESHRHAYIAGLMHDIGKLFLSRRYVLEYQEVLKKVNSGWDLESAEKSIFGYDHAMVGALLLSAWNVPTPIVEGIQLHHQSDQSKLAKVVQISHKIIEWGQEAPERRQAQENLNLTPFEIEHIYLESVEKAHEMETLFR